MELNESHKNILKYLKWLVEDDVITLRDIGNVVWLDHPQKVQDKLNQLEREKYISRNPFTWGYQVLRDFIDENVFYIPFFWFAQCGNAWKSIIDEYPRKKLPLKKELIQNEPSNYFITRAKWDSMEPLIQNWCFVLIKIQNWFHSDDKVLIVHNGQPKIKQIKEEWGKKFLISLNKEFKNFEIEGYDETHIVWVVKEVFWKNTYQI